MISATELVYDVEMKLNKVATNRHQSIPKEDILIALNEGQIQLIKQKTNINNIYKLGIDSFNKRFDDLKDLIPPDKELSIVKLTPSIYVADIDSIDDYMFFVSCYIIADKEECIDRVLDINSLIPHADVRVWLRNSNLSPSFEYQETFATLSSNGLEVYTDTTFTPKSLYLRYLRYPQKIDISGYLHLDGTPSTDSDCELPEYLKDELSDLTTTNLAAMTENTTAYQVGKAKQTD